jgi:hypothetical protein
MSATDDTHDADREHLHSMGYAQELHRGLGWFSNFAISFSIISILAGCFTSFGLGWNNGGPAAIAWGWPIISIFILIIGLLYFFFMRQIKSAGTGALNFGKSRARLLAQDRRKFTFADVAGIDEAKEDVQEIIYILKDPKIFQQMG